MKFLLFVLIAVVFNAHDGLYMQFFDNKDCKEEKGHVEKMWQEFGECWKVGYVWAELNKINETAFHIKEDCDEKCKKCRNEMVVDFHPGVCHQHWRGYGIMTMGEYSIGAQYFGEYMYEQDDCKGDSGFRMIYGNGLCSHDRYSHDHTVEMGCNKDGELEFKKFASRDCSGDPIQKGVIPTNKCMGELSPWEEFTFIFECPK